MASSPVELPERMLRRDRPVDPDFDPQEQLYVRCLSNQIVAGRLAPGAVKFPDWSVNRARYSEPEDVLLPHWHDWGIATFRVEDVPPSLTSEGGVTYEFRVEHVPEGENYAHSEVRTYKDGLHDRKLGKKINAVIKKTFRQMIADRTVIVRQPGS